MIERHVAGATVQHKSPFSDLKALINSNPLDGDIIQKYVVPFYLGGKYSDGFSDSYKKIRNNIDINLVSNLLGVFDWRPRSVGAYFSAIENMQDLEWVIGNLLLRSDVCYAGHEYCLALSTFATDSAISYLNQYLDYYLKQPDLWFDQGSAMAALVYIGSQNGKDLVGEHEPEWAKFIENKPNWSLANMVKIFESQMMAISRLQSEIHS